MAERTENKNQVAPETITRNAGGIFGFLSKEPTVDEFKEQIKLARERYDGLRIRVDRAIEVFKDFAANQGEIIKLLEDTEKELAELDTTIKGFIKYCHDKDIFSLSDKNTNNKDISIKDT